MGNNEISRRSHEYIENYIGAYLDGELDLVKSIDIETHLMECEACEVRYRNNLALRTAMRKDLPYFTAPSKLQKKILSTIQKQDSNVHGLVSVWWRWMALAASLALMAVVIFNVRSLFLPRPINETLAQEVVSGHIRSLMQPGHTVDVVSSDQHTVKPWFDGKIDFAPPVKDFADNGFRLIGGRVDYVGNRSVAALVYQHQQHFINLYIWPSTSNESRTSSATQGYNIVNWTRDGMTYWAVSDLNVADLQQFSLLVKE